jgi:nitrite reductase/ring-hydroxylating ferredoxin subunit
MDLGLEKSFTKFPVPISLGDSSYFLVHGKKGYLLLSTVCPHQGGEVVDWGSCFMCPDHGWRFEKAEGECINGPDARMYAIPVTLKGGHLFAQLPQP